VVSVEHGLVIVVTEMELCVLQLLRNDGNDSSFIGNYLEKLCNDVAVCRVWRYGRSSMVRKSPKTRHGMSCCCAHELLPMVGGAVKAGGRQIVRHMAHDCEGVGHSLQSIVATR